jgi:beta-N-acetylhexosaminidase
LASKERRFLIRFAVVSTKVWAASSCLVATSKLVVQMRRYADRPLLVAVDQEGGKVQRLRQGFTTIPPARTLAESLTLAEIETLAENVGRELLSVGVNWDFAPVLDVDTNPENPVIGDRSYSRDPHQAAELALAFARGLEKVGVASCGKHFPGHGDTYQDSHLSLPRLDHDRARLDAVELVPFAAYAAAGLSSVMTAHVLFSNVDPEVPATMSPAILTGILRNNLRFSGLIVSDDLEMRAITNHYGPALAASRGLAAGVDTFLACASHDVYVAAKEALVVAASSDAGQAERLETAAARNRAFRAHWQPSST